MAQTFTMPKFGMTMEEGKVVRWIKQPGDAVAQGEVIMEVETDKAVMDVESDQEGTMLKHLAAEGDTLKCGEPLALIGQVGEAV